jgi:hypothetical protein
MALLARNGRIWKVGSLKRVSKVGKSLTTLCKRCNYEEKENAGDVNGKMVGPFHYQKDKQAMNSVFK